MLNARGWIALALLLVACVVGLRYLGGRVEKQDGREAMPGGNLKK